MIMEDITRLCEGQSLRWTGHILEKLFQRNIYIDEVRTALMNGEIIEQYPDDYPFPSCLIMGHTKTGKAIHVVCGSNGAELWLITAYFPNPAEWTDDFRQRRKA